MKQEVAQEHCEDGRCPALVVLTGASHTGKSSVAREILDLAPPPVASLSVDGVLGCLPRPKGDPWAQIPLAYELLQPQVETLLARGWLVLYESTFTYVPKAGDPELHHDALARLASARARANARLLIVQLSADGAALESRRETTERVSGEVVAQTAALHREATALPAGTLRLSSDKATPRELALEILAELARTASV